MKRLVSVGWRQTCFFLITIQEIYSSIYNCPALPSFRVLDLDLFIPVFTTACFVMAVKRAGVFMRPCGLSVQARMQRAMKFTL
jgi:hypothetical protein